MPGPATLITSQSDLKGILPSTFHQGWASAAYQIEGGAAQGGRGPSVWDKYLKAVGKEDGEVACDSYNKWQEDIDLLKQYGSNAYRFSISWSRVIPLGGKDDPVNEEGIKFYSDLIDGLLAAGITPYVTIFHWCTPQALEDRYGGWQNPQRFLPDFLRFSRVLFERLGDRVKNWITLNEPHIFALLSGMGIKQPWDLETDPWKLGHTELIAHSQVVDLYRKEFQPSQKGSIGITLSADFCAPIDESPEAIAAASKVLDFGYRWFADPVFLGKHNEGMIAELGDRLPRFTDEEMALIKGSSDFFGLNTYGTKYATGKPCTEEERSQARFALFGFVETTATGSDGNPIGVKGENGHPYIVPWGFRKLLTEIREMYLEPNGIALRITENGFPVEGEADLAPEDALEDTYRQVYYASYLNELLQAVRDEGLKCDAYCGWSLMDNLEWYAGYRPRFGVTAVDAKNGHKRTPKKSPFVVKEIWDFALSK